MENRQLRQYYRQTLYGNRSILARSIDFIALRLVIFAVLYVFTLMQTAHVLLSAILAAVGMLMATCAIALWKSIRLDKYIEQKRMELSREYLSEKIVLLPRRRFLLLIKQLVRHMGYRVVCEHPLGLLCEANENSAFILALQNHPENKVSVQQLLDSYREIQQLGVDECLIIATAPLTDSAHAFLHELQGLQCQVLNRQKILDLAQRQGLLPDAKEVEQALLEKLEEKRVSLKKLKREALHASRVKAYVSCGAILFAASFITGQRLYYPLMGSLCFFLAFVAYYTDHKSIAAKPPKKAHAR